MSTWNRPDAMQFVEIMKGHIVPHDQLLFPKRLSFPELVRITVRIWRGPEGE